MNREEKAVQGMMHNLVKDKMLVLEINRLLGVVSGWLEGFLKDLGIPDVLGGMHASLVNGSTLILQKTLTMNYSNCSYCSL